LTNFIHASQLRGTILIKSAFRFFRYHRFYTRNMTISYQGISTCAHLSVISSTAFSTLCTVAWSAKGLTFLSGKATARNKVTFFGGGTVRITAAACLNTCN